MQPPASVPIRKIDMGMLDPLLTPIGFAITEFQGVHIPERSSHDVVVFLTADELAKLIAPGRLREPMIIPFPFVALFTLACKGRPVMLGPGIRPRLNELSKRVALGPFRFPEIPPGRQDWCTIQAQWPGKIVAQITQKHSEQFLALARQFQSALCLVDGEWPSQRYCRRAKDA